MTGGGRDAAEKLADELASELGRPVQWCLPPDKAKDIRQWLAQPHEDDDPKRLGEVFLSKAKRHEVEPSDVAPRIEFIDTRTLEATEYRLDWLVKNVLVADQPCIAGGPKKSLKTSMLIDLAVSIGTGGKFLGTFDVPNVRRVGVISGESGEATIQETYRRIRRAKLDIIPGEMPTVDVRWAFRLPMLGTAGGLADLEHAVLDQELDVVILDPIYLALLAGTKEVQASNLFHMGPLLSDVAGTCIDAGATPILVHHNTKANNFCAKPPALEDLAFAGVQEFARQWLLLGRREEYEPGSGEHRLWLNVGASAGFSSCWGVDIEEGILREDFSGRRWDVTVTTWAAQLQAHKEAERKSKAHKDREERDLDMEKIRRVLSEHPDGETFTQIHELAGMGKPKARRLLQELLELGEVKKTKVAKAGGKGTHDHDGYKLAEAPDSAVEDVEETADDTDDDLNY